jgi:hypothetical protein
MSESKDLYARWCFNKNCLVYDYPIEVGGGFEDKYGNARCCYKKTNQRLYGTKGYPPYIPKHEARCIGTQDAEEAYDRYKKADAALKFIALMLDHGIKWDQLHAVGGKINRMDFHRKCIPLLELLGLANLPYKECLDKVEELFDFWNTVIRNDFKIFSHHCKGYGSYENWISACNAQMQEYLDMRSHSVGK